MLGATGVAGQLAVQIAKHLGAGRVVGVGRNESALSKLPELGADAVISLQQPEETIADALVQHAGESGFDVVLDYLWGHPAEMLLTAMDRKGFPAPHSGTRWVQIGESAGAEIALKAMTLRGAGVTLIGSGSMPSFDVLNATFRELMDLAAHGKLHVDVEPVPLSRIESVWTNDDAHGRRFVIVP